MFKSLVNVVDPIVAFGSVLKDVLHLMFVHL